MKNRPSGSSAFDLIIFDCDGVLVDSEPLANRVWVEMLGEFGHFLDYDQSLAEFAGASMAARLRVFSERFGWTPPRNFPALFQTRLEKLMEQDLKPIEGIKEVLSSLRIPHCVASNGNPQEIAFRLAVCDLDQYFGDALFSATEVPRPKPHPDVFLAAAAAFHMVPDRCAVIEDSLPGVQAGVRAGMTVFGYAPHADAYRLQEAGAIVFSSMDQLPELLLVPRFPN